MKKKQERPDGIIAWLPDRLARNMRDAGEIIELLDDKLLTDLRFVMYAFHNDSSGKEHLAMEFARAKAYSDHLQDNVLRGTIRQEIKGRATRPLPPAFTAVEDEDSDDYLKIIASELHEHWRNVYAWKLQGHTNDEIAKRLLEAGYLHHYKYKKKKHTALVDGDYIGRHLKNPLHCGLLVSGEGSSEPRRADLNELYPEAFGGEDFPIVVTVEDFKKVNPELFSDTAKKGLQPKKRTNRPLAGKVLCKVRHERGELATLTSGATTNGSGNPSPRFMCQRCSPQHGINMPDIFDVVQEKIKEIKLTEREHKLMVVTEWMNYEKEHAAEETTRRQLAVMKGRNKASIDESRLMLRRMKHGNVKASEDEIEAETQRLKRLEEEQKDLVKREEKLNEDSLARYHDLDAFLELAKNGSLWWEKAKDEQKRKMAELLILNVIVERGKKALVSLAEPFATWAKRSKTNDGGPGGI